MGEHATWVPMHRTNTAITMLGGETATKSNYNLETYKYCVDAVYDQLTKYCNDSEYGFDRFTDNLTTLLPMDDATTTINSSMRTLAAAEWQELIENTTAVWIKVNGVGGIKFTASIANSILFFAINRYYLVDTHCVNLLWRCCASSLETDNATMAIAYELGSANQVSNSY